MGDRSIHQHTDFNFNEIRNAVYQQLASLPATPTKQGQFVQVGTDLFYADTATTWQRLVTLNNLEDRPRYVGGISVAGGVIPLVTPVADINGETSWDAGDKAVVTTGGTLGPTLPGGGSPVVSAGDLVIALVDNPTTNADFVVVQANLPPNLPLVETIVVAPADWTGAAGAWTVSKALAVATETAVSVTVVNSATNAVEYFDVVLALGSVVLNSSNTAAFTATYQLRIVKAG